MTTERERMLTGKLYYAEDSELKQLRSHVKILVDDYNDQIHTKPDRALALLPNIFGHIGDNAILKKGCFWITVLTPTSGKFFCKYWLSIA